VSIKEQIYKVRHVRGLHEYH